jgi:NAD(P)H-binding
MPLRVTVFGGTGFLGRRIVRHLHNAGLVARVACRHPDAVPSLFSREVSGIEAVPADINDDGSVARALAGTWAAVNTVSLYVERGKDTFHSVHVEAAKRIAMPVVGGSNVLPRDSHSPTLGSLRQEPNQNLHGFVGSRATAFEYDTGCSALAVGTGVNARGCAKTPAFNLRVESSSRFGQYENQKFWRRLSEEGNRENASTLSWLVHVFTRPGPFLVICLCDALLPLNHSPSDDMEDVPVLVLA